MPLAPCNDEWLPAKVYLIDNSVALVEAWKAAFAALPEVEPLHGDYFQKAADAIVSPANSFGIMDGGLDLAIRDHLGHHVQSRIQAVITDKYHGELPVGAAEIVATDHPRWKYLVAAPTMRIPEPITHSLNAYLAFRAILVAIENFNKAAGERGIDSLACCGLGTGIGQIPPAKCAAHMLAAYKSMIMPAVIGRFESIHAFHQRLRSASGD